MKFSFLLLLFFFCHSLHAQDPIFSQFYATRTYLNPAYAGFDPGGNFSINYRDQWFGVPDGSGAPFSSSYRTFNAMLDWQFPCFMQLEDLNLGLTLALFQDDAGDAPLSTSGVGLAFSYEYNLMEGDGKLKRLDFRLGAQLSYMRKTLDSDYLVYSYQLDPVVGLLGNPSSMRFQSAIYPNLNIGWMLRGKWGKKSTETHFTLGFSLSNVNEPVVSLLDAAADIHLPRRLTLHLGTTHRMPIYIGVRDPWYLSPQFRWDTQLGGDLNVQTLGLFALQRQFYLGAFVQYNFPNTPVSNTGTIGPWRSRNTTALILNAGFDLRSPWERNHRRNGKERGMVVGLSYDINLGGLDHSTTHGVLELNLQFRLGSSKNKDCRIVAPFDLYKGGECPVRF